MKITVQHINGFDLQIDSRTKNIATDNDEKFEHAIRTLLIAMILDNIIDLGDSFKIICADEQNR
jgi:hypothetical protein